MGWKKVFEQHHKQQIDAQDAAEHGDAKPDDVRPMGAASPLSSSWTLDATAATEGSALTASTGRTQAPPRFRSAVRGLALCVVTRGDSADPLHGDIGNRASGTGHRGPLEPPGRH